MLAADFALAAELALRRRAGPSRTQYSQMGAACDPPYVDYDWPCPVGAERSAVTCKSVAPTIALERETYPLVPQAMDMRLAAPAHRFSNGIYCWYSLGTELR